MGNEHSSANNNKNPSKQPPGGGSKKIGENDNGSAKRPIQIDIDNDPNDESMEPASKRVHREGIPLASNNSRGRISSSNKGQSKGDNPPMGEVVVKDAASVSTLGNDDEDDTDEDAGEDDEYEDEGDEDTDQDEDYEDVKQKDLATPQIASKFAPQAPVTNRSSKPNVESHVSNSRSIKKDKGAPPPIVPPVQQDALRTVLNSTKKSVEMTTKAKASGQSLTPIVTQPPASSSNLLKPSTSGLLVAKSQFLQEHSSIDVQMSPLQLQQSPWNAPPNLVTPASTSSSASTNAPICALTEDDIKRGELKKRLEEFWSMNPLMWSSTTGSNDTTLTGMNLNPSVNVKQEPNNGSLSIAAGKQMMELNQPTLPLKVQANDPWSSVLHRINDLLQTLYVVEVKPEPGCNTTITDAYEKSILENEKTHDIFDEFLLSKLRMPTPSTIQTAKPPPGSNSNSSGGKSSQPPPQKLINPNTVHSYQKLAKLLGDPSLTTKSRFREFYWNKHGSSYIESKIREELATSLWKDITVHLTSKSKPSLKELVFCPPPPSSSTLGSSTSNINEIRRPTKLIITETDIDRVQMCLSDWKKVLDFFKSNPLAIPYLKSKEIHKTIYAFHSKFLFEFYIVIVVRFLDIVVYSQNYCNPSRVVRPSTTLPPPPVDRQLNSVDRSIHCVTYSPQTVSSIATVTNNALAINAQGSTTTTVNSNPVTSDPVDYTSSINLSDQRSLITMFTSLLKMANLREGESTRVLSEDYLYTTDLDDSNDNDVNQTQSYHVPTTMGLVKDARRFIRQLYDFIRESGEESIIRQLIISPGSITATTSSLTCILSENSLNNITLSNFKNNTLLRRFAHIRAIDWLFKGAGNNSSNLIAEGVQRFYERMTEIVLHTVIKLTMETKFNELEQNPHLIPMIKGIDGNMHYDIVNHILPDNSIEKNSLLGVLWFLQLYYIPLPVGFDNNMPNAMSTIQVNELLQQYRLIKLLRMVGYPIIAERLLKQVNVLEQSVEVVLPMIDTAMARYQQNNSNNMSKNVISNTIVTSSTTSLPMTTSMNDTSSLSKMDILASLAVTIREQSFVKEKITLSFITELQENLKQWKQRLSEYDTSTCNRNSYKVSIVGELSAGKSTFISCLLGNRNLLPSANGAVTSVCTEIRYYPSTDFTARFILTYTDEMMLIDDLTFYIEQIKKSTQSVDGESSNDDDPRTIALDQQFGLFFDDFIPKYDEMDCEDETTIESIRDDQRLEERKQGFIELYRQLIRFNEEMSLRTNTSMTALTKNVFQYLKDITTDDPTEQSHRPSTPINHVKAYEGTKLERSSLIALLTRIEIEGPFSNLPAGVTLVDTPGLGDAIDINSNQTFNSLRSYDVIWFATKCDGCLEKIEEHESFGRLLDITGWDCEDMLAGGEKKKELRILVTKADDPTQWADAVIKVKEQVLMIMWRRFLKRRNKKISEHILVSKTEMEKQLTAEEKSKLFHLAQSIYVGCTSCSAAFQYKNGEGMDSWRECLDNFGIMRHAELAKIGQDMEQMTKAFQERLRNSCDV